MENGFGTQDIITGRGLGVGGFGYGYGMDMTCGNSGLAADAHANGTGLNARVECNGRSQAAQLDRLSSQNEETRRLLQMDDIKSNMFAFQLSNSRDLADMAAVNAQCCCDTKILVIEENSKTRELINARALNDTQRDLDRALQSGQTQTIIAACGCTPTPTQTCL